MIELILGDWHELIGRYDPALAVVITDPPYGLGAPGEADARHGLGDSHRGYVDVIPWRDHVAAVLADLPAMRHAIRGPATAIVGRDYPAPRRLCIEVSAMKPRARHRLGAVPHMWQAWAIYGRLRIGHRARPPGGDARVIRPYAARAMARPAVDLHRAITPLDAAVWITELWAEPGCVVVDPFAGIGTIAHAARTMGVDYLGAEISPAWHAEAEAMLATQQTAWAW